MRKQMIRLLAILLYLPLFLLSACGAPAAAGDTPSNQAPETETTEKALEPTGSMLRHMSFNILGTDTYPGFENDEKRNNIKAIIEGVDPDTFGVQEAAQAWTDGLVDLLEGKYAVVGGHSDPKVERPANWTNAVFYKVDKFDCLDSGMIYLNGERNYVSGKPGNNCSFALLERKEDGALILILNHHLNWLPLGKADVAAQNFEYYGVDTKDTNLVRDSQVVWSGEWGVELKAKFEQQYGKSVAVLIGGDFNVNALEDHLYEHEYTRMNEALMTRGYTDSASAVANLVTNQTTSKWVTYRKGDPSRLDYIYVSDTVIPETFTVHTIEQDFEVSSDHLPVSLDYYIGQ